MKSKNVFSKQDQHKVISFVFSSEEEHSYTLGPHIL